MKHVLTLAPLLFGTVEFFGLCIVVFINTTGLTHRIPGTSFSLLQPKLTANTARWQNHSGWELRTLGVDFGSFEFVPCYGLCISNPNPPPSVGPFVLFHSHLVFR